MQVLDSQANNAEGNISNDQRKKDESPNRGQKFMDVKHIVDDGNGFFITGINTQEADKTVDIDNEDQTLYTDDKADKFKHIAIVDCSRAFSS